MHPGDDIRNTPDGRICPRCGKGYPSLYWFKRDTASGRPHCLKCAGEAAHGSFRWVMPTREAKVETASQSPGSWIEGFIEALALTLYERKNEELLRAAGALDGWLGRDPLRILLTALAILLAARLAWLVLNYARALWSKLRELLRKNSNVPSP